MGKNILHSLEQGMSGFSKGQKRIAAYILETLISKRFGGHTVSDELGLPVTQTGLALPCGAAGRWTASPPDLTEKQARRQKARKILKNHLTDACPVGKISRPR